jgi:hypothetical protein
LSQLSVQSTDTARLIILQQRKQAIFTRSFFASGARSLAPNVTTGKPDLVITNFILSFRPANADVLFRE